MPKLAHCQSALFVAVVQASIDCSYVGTETSVRNHEDKGKHKSIIDQTGGSHPFQIVWWTASNGG